MEWTYYIGSLLTGVKFNQYKYGKTEMLLQTADTVNCAYGASFNNEIK